MNTSLLNRQSEGTQKTEVFWFFGVFSLPFSLLAVCFQCVAWKWSGEVCRCQGKLWFIHQLCTAWFCMCVGTK